MNYREYVDRILSDDISARISAFTELQSTNISIDVVVDRLIKECVNKAEMVKLHIAIKETLVAMQALRVAEETLTVEHAIQAVLENNCFILAVSMIYRYQGDRVHTDNIISAYEETGYVGDYPTAWRMLMELHRLQAVPGTMDVNEYRDVVLKYATVDTVKELTEHPSSEVSLLSLDPLSFITNTTKH